MIFSKKQAAIGDQFAVFQQRNMPRFSGGGGISLGGFEGEGQLENVSITGCCLKSITYVAIVPGQAYQATILPGKGISMESFTITIVANWTKSSEMLFEAGFSLEAGKNQRLERYIDLLRIHGVQPEYGNMSYGH